MNKLILIAIVATAIANQKCATKAELTQMGTRTYRLKYIKTVDYKNNADLTTASPIGFNNAHDNADKTCGKDCSYIETEYDTKFNITGVPEKNGFRIYSEDEKQIMSWNQRAAGKGYYMFDVSKDEFINGNYQYYTLMTYDETDKKLYSGYDNNGIIKPLGVFLQGTITEIFGTEFSNGGEETKFCFVEASSNEEVETSNECATRDELIKSNFENYKLKYKLKNENNENGLTTWTSVGFKLKYKFTCLNTCGKGGHTIRTGAAFDTTFSIEGVPKKDGFRIYSADKTKIFSWNQKKGSKAPLDGAAHGAGVMFGAAGAMIDVAAETMKQATVFDIVVDTAAATAATGTFVGALAVGSVGAAAGGVVGGTVGSVESVANALYEAPVGWGFYMYDVPNDMNAYEFARDGYRQHYTLMSYNSDNELEYTYSGDKRAAVGIRNHRRTAIYRKGQKAKFCFVKVGNANQSMDLVGTPTITSTAPIVGNPLAMAVGTPLAMAIGTPPATAVDIPTATAVDTPTATTAVSLLAAVLIHFFMLT